MDNPYPSNSNASRNGQAALPDNYQKRVDKPAISSGSAHQKEPTAWDGFREFFGIAECRSFRDYVSALSDMTNRVYGAIDTLLGNRRYQGSNVPGARVSYSTMYTGQPQNVTVNQNRSQTTYGQNGIIFDSRVDAEVVLGKMGELLGIYQNVSVGDMYDLAGLTSPNGYTDFKYGWRELNGARVIPFGSKWIIELPSVIQLR